MDFRNKGLVRKGDIGMEEEKKGQFNPSTLKGDNGKKKKEEDA
jgi:hypothetical protein